MMRLRSFTSFAIAATAMLLASGCADNLAAPKSEVASPEGLPQESLNSLLGLVLPSPKTITPVLRTTALRNDVTVSKTIGVLGGTITVPEAGLTIVVPPLAVAKSTPFRITARAGDAVAYEFEPHGTKFTLPLVVTQNLRNVKVDKNLLGLGLSLGYFPDSKQPTSVTELLNVNVDLLGQTAISTVWHFSGYIYASGRDGRGGDGGDAGY
jgi:hypothetical protein